MPAPLPHRRLVDLLGEQELPRRREDKRPSAAFVDDSLQLREQIGDALRLVDLHAGRRPPAGIRPPPRAS